MALSEADPNLYQELEAAIDLLKEHYLSLGATEINEVAMLRHGLGAMLSTLGDPFTNYIPPPQLEHYQSKKVETIVGIGLLADFDRQGRARVISALTGSPSDCPDIELGDEIFKVDGRPTRKTDQRRLNNFFKGKEGSLATLELIKGDGDRQIVEIERKAVDVDYIKCRRVGKNKAVVRIAWFSGTGYKMLLSQVETLISKGVEGLVLDLRSNSGGSIISTRNIFSAFCDQPVMYLCRKVRQENIEDRILGEYMFDLPLTVVIDGATFSAGEVLAGALKDYSRATLVGVRSGGKGSMQQVFPLEGMLAGAMRITTATNCTPSGHVVQNNGIEPHHNIDLEFPELFVDDGSQNISDSGRDYLKKLRAERLVAVHGQEKIDRVLAEGDLQLAKALDVLDELISAKQQQT